MSRMSGTIFLLAFILGVADTPAMAAKPPWGAVVAAKTLLQSNKGLAKPAGLVLGTDDQRKLQSAQDEARVAFSSYRNAKLSAVLADFLDAGQAVSFGQWKLYASQGSDLIIWHEGASRALNLQSGSNGYLWAKIGNGAYTLWPWGSKSAMGTFYGDIDGARTALAARELTKGTYSYGTWSINVAGDIMQIKCPGGVDANTVTRITRMSPQIRHEGSLETTFFGVPTTVTLSGVLGPGDAQLSDGNYADYLPFELIYGDEVQVLLASSEFDALLFVSTPDGTLLSDDDSGGLTNAFLSFTATASGTWNVIPTALSQGTGPYAVTVTVTRVVQAPTVDYAVSVVTGPAPLTVQFTNTSTGSDNSYVWDFGDGGSSTEANPSHTFTTAGTYTIKLAATNAGGSNSVAYSMTVTPPVAAPAADFTASVTGGAAPLTVSFINNSAHVPNTYTWDFGDGSTGTSGTGTKANISHTFTTPGTYTVQLTATNTGGSNSASVTITVTEPVAPVASFTTSTTSGAAPLVIRFTNTSTGTANTYAWTFGDGGTGTTASISHTFTAAGTYTVRLTATNGGGTNSATRTITVTAPAVRLLARAIVGNRRVNSPLTVEAGTTLRFEVSTFTKADTSDLQPATDFTWKVPSRLGSATALGQMSVATVAGVSDSITFQRQNARASFRLTIAPGAVSKISITPANLAVNLGQQKQFSAQGLDRYNNRVSGQTFNWYVVGGIGTIVGNTGMFTAGRTAGRGFIIAATVVNGTIVFGDNGASVTGVARVVVGTPLPEQITLHQNMPNPFNPFTEIVFDLPEAGQVRLKVFNLVGQEVAKLLDESLPAGSHRVRWDASGQPTGTYIYVLEAGSYREQRKMLLLR